MVESIKNEIKINLQISHPNIAQLIEVQETNSQVFLIFELVEGGRLIQKDQQLEKSNKIIKQYIFTLLKVLEYLAGLGVVHRDIKPSNILLSKSANELGRSEPKLTLIDFGLSSLNKNDIQYFCGTPGFIPPEVYRSSQKDFFNSKMDVFSLGIIFHYLQFGRYPLEIGSVGGKHAVYFPEEDFKICGLLDQKMDEDDFMAYDLMTKMVRLEQTKRYGVEECLKHPYFKSAEDGNIAASLDKQLKRESSLQIGNCHGPQVGTGVKVKKLKSF